MKIKILFTTLILILSSKVIASSNLPKEDIFYASMFDTVCTTKTDYKIHSVWVNELKNKLPQWKKSWEQQGNQLLNTTVKLIDFPFKENNFKVALSLCSFPSMSAPLIVNARYALNTFTEHPISDDVLISTIYHEILHNYIDSYLPENTPLLEKYGSESQGVLNHLHLFAVEKAVYLNLGWQTKLKMIIEKDQSLPNADYKRAWEIVNSKENYASFITELRKRNIDIIQH